MTKNCAIKTEGHREIIQGFGNLSKGGQTDRPSDRQTDRPTDRYDVINREYENPS